MDIQEFLGIGIVGVAASVLIEVITRYAGSKPLTAKVLSVGVALVLGTAYFFVRQTVWFPTVLGILAISSTVYALFFNKNK